MSVDIHCEIDGKWYQDIDVKFPGNEWIVGDETGITLPTDTIIENLSKYYHDKFIELCKDYPGEDFEWLENKSKDILEYKGTNRIEFFLL